MNRRKFIGLTGVLSIGGIIYSQNTKTVLATSESKIITPDNIALDDGNTLNIPFESFEIEGQNIDDSENIEITYSLIDKKNNIIEETTESINIDDGSNFNVSTDDITLSVDSDKLYLRSNEYRLKIVITHININIDIKSNKFKIDNKHNNDLYQIYVSTENDFQKRDASDFMQIDMVENQKYELLNSDDDFIYGYTGEYGQGSDVIQKINPSDLSIVSNYNGGINSSVDSIWVDEYAYILISDEESVYKIDTTGDLTTEEIYEDDDLSGIMSNKSIWGDKEHIYVSGSRTGLLKIKVDGMERVDICPLDNRIDSVLGFNNFVYVGTVDGEVIKINRDTMEKENEKFELDYAIRDIVSHDDNLYILGRFDMHKINTENMEEESSLNISSNTQDLDTLGEYIYSHSYNSRQSPPTTLKKIDPDNMNTIEEIENEEEYESFHIP